MNKQKIDQIFTRFSEQDPAPVTELTSYNDFTLLVAIVLSAQATDVSVNKASPALFAAANSPQKMVALGEEGIKNYIRTIGLYIAKARNVLALSQKIIKEFSGQIPETREALQTLPGVGTQDRKRLA